MTVDSRYTYDKNGIISGEKYREVSPFDVIGGMSLELGNHWIDCDTGLPLTDPDEIAKLEREKAVRLERQRLVEAAAEERIRLANETGNIKFSSGRYMEPASGIVGLSPNLEVCEGADGPMDIRDIDGWHCGHAYPQDLSELADVMIDRWQRFKDSLKVK